MAEQRRGSDHAGVVSAAKHFHVGPTGERRTHAHQHIAWPKLRNVHDFDLQLLFAVQDGRGHLLSHSVLTSGAVLRSSTIPRRDATPAQFQHEYRLMNIDAKSILPPGVRPKKLDRRILSVYPRTRYRNRTACVLPYRCRRPILRFVPDARSGQITKYGLRGAQG